MKPEKSKSLEPMVRVFQIICLSMMAGVTFFVALAFFVSDKEMHTGLSMLTMIGLVFAIPAYVCSFIVPRIYSGSALKVAANKLDDEGHKADSEAGLKSIFGVLQSANIIRYAMLEGAMFLNAILFFLDGSVISLVIVGLGLIVMALHFPRQDSAIAWVEERASDVIQNRV